MMGLMYSNSAAELAEIRIGIDNSNSHMAAMLYKLEQIRTSFSDLCAVTNSVNGIKDLTRDLSAHLINIGQDMGAGRASVNEHIRHMEIVIGKLSEIADDPWINRTIDDLKAAASQFNGLLEGDDQS